MSWLELKIPPPVVALCLGALMWLAAQIVPAIEVSQSLRIGLSLVCVAIGLFFDLTALIAFLRVKTTPNPLRPLTTSSLVSTGLYRFSRNPMYLGQLLVLLGWALFLSNIAALVLTPLFVLYLNRFQIIPEERALSKLFGAEFTAYKLRVRRWL